MQITIEFPNLHVCDFLCLNLISYINTSQASKY